MGKDLEKQPVRKLPKEIHELANDARNNEVVELLRDSWNCPKLICGLIGLTAILVIVFLSIAMFIGH